MSRKPEPTNGYLDGNGESPYGARADHNHDAVYAATSHDHAGLGKAVTIAVADWSGGTSVEKSISGVTVNGAFAYLIDPADQSAATTAGFAYTSRAAGKVTFGCTTTPPAAIRLVVFAQ